MDDQKNQINDSGLRATPARIAVLDVLTSSKAPLDISAINNLLEKLKVDADQATIYRIIENFMQKGLINRFCFQDRKFYYEANRGEHHHAICTSCGIIEDVSNCKIRAVEAEIETTIGFKVESHSLEFFGLCKNCNN